MCTRVHACACAHICVCAFAHVRASIPARLHACVHLRARIRGCLGHFVADFASAARDSVQNGSRA